MQRGVVLAVAARGRHDHDGATCERLATETAPDIIQTADATAHERTPHVFRRLIQRVSQPRGHGQDDRAREDARMQHRADLAAPVVDVDVRASEAQRRFTAHRHAVCALPTRQTAGLDRAHFLWVPAPEQRVHACILVAFLGPRIDVLEPVPGLDTELFEDVPVPRRVCNPQDAPSWRIGMVAVQLFYHASPA